MKQNNRGCKKIRKRPQIYKLNNPFLLKFASLIPNMQVIHNIPSTSRALLIVISQNQQKIIVSTKKANELKYQVNTKDAVTLKIASSSQILGQKKSIMILNVLSKSFCKCLCKICMKKCYCSFKNTNFSHFGPNQFRLPNLQDKK